MARMRSADSVKIATESSEEKIVNKVCFDFYSDYLSSHLINKYLIIVPDV